MTNKERKPHTMKIITKTLVAMLAVFAVLCSPVHAQGSLTVTSLSAAVGNTTGTGSASAFTTVQLASCTNVNNPTLPIAGGPAIGDPSAAPYTYLVIDKEVMKVNNVQSTSPCKVLVERGFTGSIASPHISGQMVYVTPPNQLLNIDPVGACTAANTKVQPAISYTTSTVWKCTAQGQWARAFSIDNTLGFAAGFQATESGANNAIVVAKGSGPALVAGLVITVKLAHTLQAGANTFNYQGTGAKNIKSHFNVANDIATAYAATGVIQLLFDGTEWLDMSE